ncbi:MAG: ATP-binding protein [Elusimicrobiota bacterium]
MKLLGKLLLLFVPSALLLSATAVFFSQNAVHEILMAEVRKRGITIARNIAKASATALQTREELSILPHLQRGKDQAGALYALALAPSGEVLAHTNVAEAGKKYHDQATIDALRLDHPHASELMLDGKAVLDISLPIYQEEEEEEEDFLFSGGKDSQRARIATLRLGLPVDGTMVTYRKIFIKQSIFISMAIGALSVVLIIFIVANVLRPVRRLAEGTSRVSEGQYGHTIASCSEDELGLLAGAFNTMSRTLAMTTVSRDFVDAVLSNMLEPLFVLNADGAISSLNHAAIRLLGHPADELIGKPADILFAGQKPSFLAVQNGARLPREPIHNLDLALQNKNGNRIPIHFSASLLADKQGRPIGTICVARDMTEIHRLQTRMVQSEKLSAVGQLAAGVAHELNNPLGVILGFAQSVKRRIKETDLLAMPISSIERESLRCKKLVQDLLTFSRRKDQERETFDLDRAISATVGLVKTQAKVRSVSVETDLAAAGTIYAERDQVQQILINLCGNAVDAMPEGGVLRVASRRTSQDGRPVVRIEVSDTGTGIEQSVRGRIFEPFFTTKEVGKGTGLGLSIVYEIVEKHGGTIDCASRPGEGTTFTVTLPLEAAEVAA